MAISQISCERWADTAWPPLVTLAAPRARVPQVRLWEQEGDQPGDQVLFEIETPMRLEGGEVPQVAEAGAALAAVDLANQHAKSDWLVGPSSAQE